MNRDREFKIVLGSIFCIGLSLIGVTAFTYDIRWCAAGVFFYGISTVAYMLARQS